MEKKKITLASGETFAYIDEGRGEPVVLIHGNMSSSLHFSPITAELAKHYRVLAPDLRGFGDSSYNNRFDTLAELADDVKAFADALGIERAHFAGWSTGGGIVFELAAKYPSLVRSAFIIEGTTHRGYPIYRKDEKGVPKLGEVYADKDELARDPVQVAPMLALLTSGNAAGMGFVWDKTIYTGKNKPTDKDNAVWLAETMKQKNLVDLDWALAALNMGSAPNGYADGDGSIDKVVCPVALTVCEKDIVVPEAMTLDNAAAIGDNAKLVRYPESGHSPLVDEPEKLTADILAFFGGVK